MGKLFKPSMLRNCMNKIALFIFALVFMLTSARAVSVESVNVDILRPGETGRIIIDIENNFDETARNVVFDVDVSEKPFNIVGSSSFGVNRIDEDDDERFAFGIRVSATAEPGEYQIPYKLSYTLGDEKFSREGAIGVKVTAESIVDFSADVDRPVVGERGKINFNIINKGLGDLGFVSVKIIPDGFTLLSEQKVHIGDIDSDDFEIASFDVLFTDKDASVKVIAEYRDSENKLFRETVKIPLTIYSREKAIELGIISKNNTWIYVSFAVAVIALWLIIGAVRKRRRMRRSQGG